MTEVLSFLHHLFEKGLQYSTLCVSRSMLSNAIPPQGGMKMGERGEVVRFLKGVFNSRPHRKCIAPEWDLPLVLEALTKAPFEPLEGASMKMVTFKLTFLLAVTSARRVSDLTKLAIGDHCRFMAEKVTFLPTSLAKADDPSHFQQEVSFHSFRDRQLCPLRILKHYLMRTESLRGSGSDRYQLLRILNDPYKPPSAQTVARWLVATIRLAYEGQPTQPGESLRAHSTRAIAPNWARFKGASKQKILEAADWRRETTFTKFYCRELREQQDSFGQAVLSAADLQS